MSDTLLPPEVVEAARRAARELIASDPKRWNATKLGKRIGISQPAMSRFLNGGGGLKPKYALELFRVTGRPVPDITGSIAAFGLPSVPSKAGEGERLATLTRLDHEFKHARYLNLEIHLLASPPESYPQRVIALARAHEWEADVPPWEWPARLQRVGNWLETTNFDAEPPARLKKLEKRT